MSDRPTPETDKASFSTVYQGEIVKASFARSLERQRNELLHALQRIDPFPNDDIQESWNGNTVYCEITVREIRLIRAAIARVKGGGA